MLTQQQFDDAVNKKCGRLSVQDRARTGYQYENQMPTTRKPQETIKRIIQSKTLNNLMAEKGEILREQITERRIKLAMTIDATRAAGGFVDPLLVAAISAQIPLLALVSVAGPSGFGFISDEEDFSDYSSSESDYGDPEDNYFLGIPNVRTQIDALLDGTISMDRFAERIEIERQRNTVIVETAFDEDGNIVDVREEFNQNIPVVPLAPMFQPRGPVATMDDVSEVEDQMRTEIGNRRQAVVEEGSSSRFPFSEAFFPPERRMRTTELGVIARSQGLQ